MAGQRTLERDGHLEVLRRGYAGRGKAGRSRLLALCKARGHRSKSGTRPGMLLRHQVPLQGEVWDERRQGFLEADSVAHCGGSLAGNLTKTTMRMWNRRTRCGPCNCGAMDGWRLKSWSARLTRSTPKCGARCKTPFFSTRPFTDHLRLRCLSAGTAPGGSARRSTHRPGANTARNPIRLLRKSALPLLRHADRR